MYLFTPVKSIQQLFLENTSSGGCCINDTMVHLSVHDLPFGGVGHSGMGAYHGKASFDTFTHRKSCLIRNYNKIAEGIGKLRYPPYSEKNTKMLSRLLKETNFPSFKIFSHLLAFCLGVVAVFAIKGIAKSVGDDDD